MEPIKYSSYAQIETDLEILKLEKEIQYQKMVLKFQQTKDNITPQSVVNNFVDSYVEKVSLPFDKIFKSAYPFLIKTSLPFLIKWISHKFK